MDEILNENLESEIKNFQSTFKEMEREFLKQSTTPSVEQTHHGLPKHYTILLEKVKKTSLFLICF